MKQDLLTHFPWPWLPSLALLIFFVFFLGLLFRVFSKREKPILAAAERLPFDDGEKL